MNIDNTFELDSADEEEDAPTVILHISGHPEFYDSIGTLIEEISSYAIRITTDPDADADNKVLIKGAVTPVLYIGDAAFSLYRWADLPPGNTANYVIGLIWGYLAGAEGSAAA